MSVAGEDGSPDGPVVETGLHGYELLNDPLLNKGTAFSEQERETFGLHGLLPPNVASLDEQVGRRLKALRQLPNDLARYVFLRGLQDSNEVLFYALLVRNLSETLPIIVPRPSGSAASGSATSSASARAVLSLPHQQRIASILANPHFDNVEAIVSPMVSASSTPRRPGRRRHGIPSASSSIPAAAACIRQPRCRSCSMSGPTIPRASPTRSTSDGITSGFAAPHMTSSWKNSCRR
jgi:hypothetical protein